jgi:ubiquinone/menaquinone biosynthesis C-methylase UbiE
MSFDANDHRRESLAGWEDAAAGWVRRADTIRSLGAPVSAWMLDAVSLQPGERVLELAAGLGETGMMAAEQVAPMGGVIISDQAESMLAGARERAQALELNNIEFQVLNAEWIDLPVASVDAVLCRWGYMLMADPAAALGETRRVLRPGGRVALAVWDSVMENPWSALPAAELIERGLLARPAKGTPSPFALGDPQRVRELLEQAGFVEIEVTSVELTYSTASFDAFWETTLDVSRGFHDAVLSLPEPQIEAIRAGVEKRLAPFIRPDGSLEIPARTLVARAMA